MRTIVKPPGVPVAKCGNREITDAVHHGVAQAAPPTNPPPGGDCTFAPPVSAPGFCPWMNATTAAASVALPAYPGSRTVEAPNCRRRKSVPDTPLPARVLPLRNTQTWE